MKGADLLIGRTVGMKRVIADRGYDANRIRAALREEGTVPVMPGRRKRQRPLPKPWRPGHSVSLWIAD